MPGSLRNICLAENVVGTLGNRAKIGHHRHTGGHGHQKRNWDVSSRLVGLEAHGTEARAWYDASVRGPKYTRALHEEEHLEMATREPDRMEHPAEHNVPGRTGGDKVRPVDVVGVRAIRATKTGMWHLMRVGETERFTHLAG